MELSLLFNCPFLGRIFTIKIMKNNMLIRKKVHEALIPKAPGELVVGLFPAHRNAG